MENVMPTGKSYNHSGYFQNLSALLPTLDFSGLHRMTERLLAAWREQKMLFICGNGGSAALASHLACDLGKGLRSCGVEPFRVMALTDNTPLLTAWSNDCDFTRVFAEQLASLARPGDMILAISASGRSPNVLQALRSGRKLKCQTLGLSGGEGGDMKALCDVCWTTGTFHMQQIEDLHNMAAHSVFLALGAAIQAEARPEPVTDLWDAAPVAA